MRMSVRISLFLLLSACGVKPTTESETKGIYANSRVWANPSAIPVCWANPSGSGVTSAVMADIQNAVTAQYARTQLVRFVGWNSCDGNSSPDVVRFYLDDTKQDGRSSLGSPGTSNLGAYGYPNATTYVGIKDFSTDFGRRSAIAAAIHELGHAAGLAHEHQRTDSPCPMSADQADIPNDGINYIYTGPVDGDSIMSYCNRMNQTLSVGDVKALDLLHTRKMVSSARSVALKINAMDGARHGAKLILHSGCDELNTDCLWNFLDNGMIVSARDPGLAINAMDGARHGAELVLHNACTPSNLDCVWIQRPDGMIVSARDQSLGINAKDGAGHGAYLILHSACTAGNPDCLWRK